MPACPNCGFEQPQQEPIDLSLHFVGACIVGPDSVKQIMDQISKGLDPRVKPKGDDDVPEQ